MPSWFHGIKAAIAILTGVVGLIGTIVGILISFGILGGEEPVPVVNLVTESKVMVGQQVDILGKNLDLVSGVRLTRGLDVSIPLTYTQVSESQLTMTIPSSAQPNRYNLILITSNGDTLATGQQIEVSSTLVTPAPLPTPTVVAAGPTPIFQAGASETPSPVPETRTPRSSTPTPFPTTTINVQKGLIAFSSDRDGDQEIYVMNPDGTGLKNLTDHPGSDEQPGWSLDDSKIVFQSHRDGNWEIYIMNTDGSNQVRLTDSLGDDLEPAWSPDGTQIVFASNRSGNQEIYTMNTGGSGLTQLTSNPASDNGPVWSPDGTKIAFASDRRTSGFDVYLMGLNGEDQTLIGENAGDPAWSSDGRKIALESNVNDDFELQTMNSDGSNRTRVTQNVGLDARPTWSPDGSRIAFHSERDGNLEIYVIDSDGSNPRRLTDHPAADSSPAWAPR